MQGHLQPFDGKGLIVSHSQTSCMSAAIQDAVSKKPSSSPKLADEKPASLAYAKEAGAAPEAKSKKTKAAGTAWPDKATSEIVELRGVKAVQGHHGFPVEPALTGSTSVVELFAGTCRLSQALARRAARHGIRVESYEWHRSPEEDLLLQDTLTGL